MMMLSRLYSKLQPWIVWLLSASFFYYKYLIQVSPGVMNQQLMSSFSLTGAQMGNLAACFFYGYLIMQIPVGLLLDRYNPGRVAAIAAFVCALNIYIFANSNFFIHAAVSRFMIGVSASFAAVTCFKLASIWFEPKRFALVAGLSMTIGMLGAVGGQGPLSLLIEKYQWRGALENIAFLGILLSLLIWIFIPHHKKSQPTVKIKGMKIHLQFNNILKNKQTWLLSFYSGLAFAPVSVFGGLWGVSFITKAYALTTLEAAKLLEWIFIGFAVGCPLSGWLSDFLQHRKKLMFLGTTFALLTLCFILYYPLSLCYLRLNLFLFGLGASCFFLCFSMIRELNSLSLTATVLGFMNTFDSICEAITEPLIGKFLDLNWDGTYIHGARDFSLEDYHLGLFALLIYLVMALLLLFFIKETHCRILEE